MVVKPQRLRLEGRDLATAEALAASLEAGDTLLLVSEGEPVSHDRMMRL